MNLCIAVPGSLNYSETFIKAHIKAFSAYVVFADQLLPGIPNNSSPYHRNKVAKYKYKLNQLYKRNIIDQLNDYHISKLFRNRKIDILLAEYGFIGARCVNICKKNNLPLVVHFHGFDAYMKNILQRYAGKYWEMFDYAAAIIVVSKDMKSKLLELGAPAQKIFHNVYGVDTDDFNQSFPGNAPPLLLGVGRFVEKKAPYLTIMAFQKVLDKMPEAKLLLVGTGELYDVCQKIIESHNLSHAIDLRGEVKHKELAFLFQGARAFVQHSLVPACGDSEGTPVAILEAGACGLPVVSTFHAGISDVVINGETGFLVNEGDIDGMADSMLQLLNNPALADKMGAKARKHIQEKYTMERSISKLKLILENAIKGEFPRT